MLIPAAEPARPPLPRNSASMSLAMLTRPAPSTFRSSLAKRNDEERTDSEHRGRVKKRNRKRCEAKETAVASTAESTYVAPVILIGLAAIAVVLALLGYFVPGVGRWSAWPGIARVVALPLRLCVRRLHRVHRR